MILGGDMIHFFAVALFIGITVGTFSSIYVSAALLLPLKLQRADLMPAQKEDAEAEEELPDRSPERAARQKEPPGMPGGSFFIQRHRQKARYRDSITR